jgi:tetratricopeptide (TPR) repeat protein
LEEPHFQSILTALENAFTGCVSHDNLEQYRAQRDEYNRRFDEYKAAISIGSIQLTMEASDQSSISASSQSIQINAQLHKRELQLRKELAGALIELSKGRDVPLFLFIDGYERLVETNLELANWLFGKILLDLTKTTTHPLRVLICGWEWPSDAIVEPFYTFRAELDDFDLLQVKSYLEKHKVIARKADLSSLEQDKLVTAFYELTKGHPLALALAVVYFSQLELHEQTEDNLRADRPLVDEKARVAFLEERLLSRLEDPYRTLLEHAPILRSLNLAALQVLLSRAGTEGGVGKVSRLDERTYARFLRYPFIKQTRISSGDTVEVQFIFHQLVRSVALSALRRHYPETKERLHRIMVEYYQHLEEAERMQEAIRSLGTEATFNTAKPDFAEWFAEIPEREFRILLELLYHSLQVKALQIDAFEMWIALVGRAVSRWRRRQAGSLLELIQQLEEEGEPFMSKGSDPYGQYLLWYSRFLEQEARWEKARDVLERAAEVFRQTGNRIDLAICLNNIGCIYESQGKLEEALSCFERTLTLREQVNDPAEIAQSLNSIGNIYSPQGKFEEALSYYERALTLSEQVGDPAEIAQSLNNIGVIYNLQGNLEEALSYLERALNFREQAGTPIYIAQSLNNIGNIYRQQRKLEKALSYFERALALDEQVGNPVYIATSLNNIGFIYQQQGKLDEALRYHERALALRKQVGNPVYIATSLNNIGFIYRQQGKLDEALRYHEPALALDEQVGNVAGMAAPLSNIGFIYWQQGKLKEALSFYNRALALDEQIGNPIYIAQSHSNIGFIYQQQEIWQQAVEKHTMSLNLYESLGQGFESVVADELEALSICYTHLSEFEKGSAYQTRADQIRKEIKNKGNYSDRLE